ncbi:CbtB-domain containing protein [Streptomyces luteireticuli]|uniref:CbtB domain-containing protein n=1 Tax=Streptomyces luteireticuli TaxID=173858 RepID=UPI003555FC34
MAHPAPVAPTAPVITPISLKSLAPWAILVGLLALTLLYFVGAEQGATAALSGAGVHEWVHDARHLLGFPCH